MKFIIDRSKWLRGTDDSVLLDPDTGKMCCVGQMCVQLGQNPNTLKTNPRIDDISLDLLSPSVMQILCDPTMAADQHVNFENDWVAEAYRINDGIMTEEKREKELTAMLRNNGHEIEFIDGTP